MERELSRLKEIMGEVRLLTNIAALMGWDQEINLPPAGIEERGEQMALLEGMLHRKATDPEVGELLAGLEASDNNPMGNSSLPDLDRRLIRNVFRAYNRQVKIPEALVKEMAKLTSRSQAVWAKARQDNDFASFAPYLEKIVKLNKEKAECLGYKEHPYDPLLDEYEPWMRTAEVSRVFGDLKNELARLIGDIRGRGQVRHDFMFKDFPVETQDKFSRSVLKDMGYDFHRGRLDLSTHPFTTTLGSDDVRVTTRYNKNLFSSGLGSVVHEGGHALYELGMGEGIKGTILGQGTSLGIHESQSRMWENVIGRSKPFWKHYFPKLKELFPAQLEGVDLDAFYKAFNKVEPTLIRVEADEVTYSLHIILRFEIEMKLITGALSVADIPEYWNTSMKNLVGVLPPSDREGCLQDIHWSIGAIGYFPTYALGNLYAAQFNETMRKDMPDVDSALEKGELSAVLKWLRENIHAPGSSLTAGELISRVSGRALDPSCFTAYLREKYSEIYAL